MPERTVEDRLREEYFELLPDIRRVAVQLEAEIKYGLLSISLRLEEHEQVVVTSRIKECESAVEALRRRQEGSAFNSDRPQDYTLTQLKDLAGVRVLVFPPSRLTEIDGMLRKQFGVWVADPVPGYDANDKPLAYKYYGRFEETSVNVSGEYQIVSMLIGRFWEVEHSAIYKPTPRFKPVARSLAMKERSKEVLQALGAFEEQFEELRLKRIQDEEAR